MNHITKTLARDEIDKDDIIDVVEETRDEIDKDEVIVDVDVNVSLDVDVSPTFFTKVEENKTWQNFCCLLTKMLESMIGIM